MSGITLKETAAASIPTPAADKATVFIDASTGQPAYKDDAGAAHTFGVPWSILDAKGDIISASAADTPARLPVGANGSVLRAASGTATGLEWQLNNLAASAAPAVTDDSGDGYGVGSRWIDTTNDLEYVCADATVGAAVWLVTTAPGDLFVGPFDPQQQVGGAALVADQLYAAKFQVHRPVTVTAARIAPSTASGNIDVSLYNAAGARLGSSGSVACPAAGSPFYRDVAFTGAVILVPGWYRAAFGCDNTTARFISFGPQSSGGIAWLYWIGMWGAAATSFPLPDPLPVLNTIPLANTFPLMAFV